MAKAKTEVAKAKSSLTGVKLAKSKKSLPAEVPEEMFFALANLYSEVAAIEKKVKLSSDGFERYATRISTGCLALDMYLDGGLVPGGWYTFSGGEQSCKSTLAMTVMASCIKSMTSGLTFVFDYEGSSDPIYIKNILKTFRMEIEEIQIFGLQDEETGEYIIKPKIKYYAPDTGTKFFDFMAMMRRRLPDKIVQKDGTAYLLYPNTKPNAKLCAGKYDKRHFSQHNEFKVAAPDGGMQVLVIVDSFPAMLPDLQDDDEASAAMAIQARMFSDGIKRFRGGMRRKLITILGVNQLRQKPAVMYGDPAYEPCFIGSTPVHLADGTVDTIRNIVLKKREVEVLSFDKVTGEVSAKRIVAWKDNGNKLTSDLVKVAYNAFDHNGCRKAADFVSTKDHKVWTPCGWKKAGDLREGDSIYLNVPKDSYSSDQQQVIYGSLLGDGSFSCDRDSIGWNVAYKHVRYQVPYMMWKAQTIDYGDVFDVPNDSSVQRYKPSGEFSSFTTFRHYNPTIARYARLLKSNHTKYVHKHISCVKGILDKLDLRGLAVWYMDDGHFANDRKNGLWTTTISCDRFNADLKRHAIDAILSLTGVRFDVDQSHGKLILKGKADCIKFQSALSDYIHPSMAYKLFDCSTAGVYSWVQSDPSIVNTMVKTKVISVGSTDIKSKYTRVYDLTIEDNHTYFVGGSSRNCDLEGSRVRRSVRADGVAVSNCGDALKFYCYGPDTYIHSATHGLIQAKDTLGLTGAQFESISGQAPVEATFKVGEDKVQLAYFVTSGNSKITVRPGHAFYALQRRKIDPSVAVEGSSLVAFDHSWTDVAKLHVGDFLLSRVEDCAVDLDADGRYKYTAHTYCTTKGTALPDEVRMLQPQALYEFCRSVIDQFGYSAVKGEHNVCRIKSQNTSELAELLRAAGLVVLARHSMYIDVLHLNTSLNPFSQAHRELATAACWYDFIEEMDSGLANLLRADMATNARIKRFTVAAMDACVDDAAINGTISSELHDRYSTVLGYVSDIQEDLGMNVVPQMLYPKYINSIKPCRTRIQFYDCNVPNSESVVANGLVGHNSDVRIRLQSRAIPQGWKGEAGIVSEPSVEYEEGIDQYRFIHAKTIKNKLGGIPNQQTWLRLWQADGNGDARGFDPVYDTWHFLKNLNLVVGTRASIKFTDTTPFGGSKAITWEEFRVLINGDKKQIQKVCDKMGVKKAGRIRNWCFEYLATPKGKQAVRDSIVKAVKTKKSEDEE